jgi:hypothetical protein
MRVLSWGEFRAVTRRVVLIFWLLKILRGFLVRGEGTGDPHPGTYQLDEEECND